MMNRYRTKFTAKCPVNGKVVRYELLIETGECVMVEDILQQVAALPKFGFHEDLANRLAAVLPGQQTLRAHHHGVDIETVRGGV